MKRWSWLLMIVLVGAGSFYLRKTKELQPVEAKAVVVEPEPEPSVIQKELADPTLAERTGTLEIIAGQVGEKPIWLYSLQTAAGPIRLQPQEEPNEELLALIAAGGGYVHLRESQGGYQLADLSDERRFQFEMLHGTAGESAAQGKTQLKKILVSPVPDGPKTQMWLKRHSGDQSFIGFLKGPRCLAAQTLFPLVDQALEKFSSELPDGTKLQFVVLQDARCEASRFRTLGPSLYFGKPGIKRLSLEWITEPKGPREVLQAKKVEPLPENDLNPSKLRITEIKTGATCDSQSVSVGGLKAGKVYQVRAHQVGAQHDKKCEIKSQDQSGGCTIEGLEHQLPYLISVSTRDEFRLAFVGPWTCASPIAPALSFLDKPSKSRKKCQGDMSVALRTQNLLAGSQVLVMAESQQGARETCLATVNESEGVGLARCRLSQLKVGEDYSVLAQYGVARAWTFLTCD